MAENPLLQLEHELVAAALRRAATGAPVTPVPSRRSRRGSRRRLLVMAVLVLLLLAVASLAAVSLLKSGEPVPYRFGEPAKAHSGYGAPVSTGMFGPVADPQGGLPWAVRVVRTSRDYGCVQIGRLYEGRLGVLGTYGVFHDDGLFHELPADHLSSRATCVPLDGHGDPRVTVHLTLGVNGAQHCIENGDRHHFCSAEHSRTVDYGLLGPDATGVEYQDASGVPGELTPGPDGAYLIVLPRQPLGTIRTPGGHDVNDGLLITATPSSHVIKKVRYRDGTACRVQVTREFPGGCPGHGPAPLRVRRPSTRELTTPLRLAIRGQGDAAVLHIAFRARVAATGSRSDYHLIVKPERIRRRPLRPGASSRCMSFQSFPLERDVVSGELVQIDVPLADLHCTGPYTVRLEYRVEHGPLTQRGPTSSYPGRLVANGRVAP
ncbi:MAG: hypothetical protein JWM73_1804 [Solirubrobacterales bacterium]|nr:hypothetical protein [Solirubrobacterales bacterium]